MLLYFLFFMLRRCSRFLMPLFAWIAWGCLLPPMLWALPLSEPIAADDYTRGSRQQLLLPVAVREWLPLDFFADRYLSFRLSALLTHTLPQSTYQLESTGAFSFADGEVYSLYGHPWLWNRSYINTIETTSAYFSGRSLYRLLPLGHDVAIDGLAGTRNYVPAQTASAFNYTAILIGQVGPMVPYAEAFSNIHRAAQIREIPAPTERPGAIAGLEGFQRHVLQPLLQTDLKPTQPFVIDLFYHLGTRQFLQFTHESANQGYSVFKETAAALTVTGYTQPLAATDTHVWTGGFMASLFTREHWGAEFHLREEETLGLNSLAVTTYAKRRAGKLNGTIALTLGLHELTSNAPAGNSYNLLRVSGEGLYPFTNVPGTIVEFTPQTTFSWAFDVYRHEFLKLVEATRFAIVAISPAKESFTRNVYFQDDDQYTNAVPLYQSHVQQADTVYGLLAHQLGISINDATTDWWEVEAGFDLDALLLVAESVARVTPYFRVELRPLQTSRVSLGILLGRENTTYTTEYAQFLSDSYQNTVNYVATDSTSADTNATYSTAGGRYQSLADNFKQPHYYYLDIPFTAQLARAWTFSLGGHYRLFKQMPWVCYKGAATNYGEYRDEDGTNVFYETNGEKQYELCNLPSSYFPESGRTWFNNSPMYLGATTGFNGIGKRYTFAITFTAYLLNGITRQGNGPVHNSLGVFEYSMADPNNLLKPVGRYDMDRSYLVRVFASYQFLKNLTGAFVLSYRDGQPAGSWDYFLDQDGPGAHVSWLRDEVSGDNLLLYNGEFGTREDARWNLDLRFKWRVSLSHTRFLDIYLNVYNLLDFALETLEYTVYDFETENRIALETEPARSIELSLRYFY